MIVDGKELFFVYMLKCWKSDIAFKRKIPKHGHLIYTGYSENVIRRIRQHKRVAKKRAFTAQFKGRIELGYLELYDNKTEALKREKQIKKLSRDKKVKLMQDVDKKIIQYIKKKI